MMGNDELLAQLCWFDSLTHEQRLIELKKDSSLCDYVYLFKKEMDDESIEFCETVLKFRML